MIPIQLTFIYLSKKQEANKIRGHLSAQLTPCSSFYFLATSFCVHVASSRRLVPFPLGISRLSSRSVPSRRPLPDFLGFQTIRTPHLHHSPTRLELLFGVENAAAHTSTMNSMVGRENGHLHAWSERKTPPLPWRGPCEWCHAARAPGRRGGVVDTNV